MPFSLAIAHLFNKQYDDVILSLNKALEISPNFGLANGTKRYVCFLLSVVFKEGLESLRIQ
jgi:hypothetical protein